MNAEISEIQFTPIRPKDGIVGFASFVLNGWLYLGSIAVMTRPQGGYRLLYPTRKIADRNIGVFHPIERDFARMVEEKILEKAEDVLSAHDRYDCPHPQT
ncbi:MAG: septation protein SpoVG family protein [Candidatus Omnitrophica bacterium]|nr:septation protein SpoVG family protein [Candidatus Omnitrophota bacterium]